MISVIVPVYNVEAYLPRCLNSLKKQSFSDVEFIIVDDGSSDHSGSIADRYTIDGRFRVFHTQNYGLSSARNYGIDRSRGEWIMFVDGDDYVSHLFCEIPFREAIKNDADLVIFQSFIIKNGIKHRRVLKIPLGIIDTELALRYGECYAWNKFYKRSLFRDIRYPEGKVYEDVAITHKLVVTANRILVISDILYYQIYRKNSISQSCSAKNKREGFLSAVQRGDDLKNLGYSKETYEQILLSYAIALLVRSEPCNDSIIQMAENVLESASVFSSELSAHKRIMLIIWKMDKRLFHFICRVMGQKDNKV